MSDDSDHKILRLGLIQNGKIVEERLMRDRSDVTIGQDFEKNDIVVPIADLPASFPVFEVRGDGYVLNFTSGMEGRISAAGEVRSLEEAARSGDGEKTDDGYRLELSPESRGRVQIGDVTLLFQFVTPPPKQPQPALPASMRGGWIKGLDRALVGIIALSAALQIGFVVYVENTEWPQPKDMRSRIPDRFVEVEKQDVDEPDLKKKKKKKTKTKKEGKAQAKEKAPEPSPSPEPKKEEQEQEKSPEEKAAEEAKRQRQMAKEVENKTILSELGHVSEDDGGVASALEEGAGAKTMEQAFENSEGTKSGGPGAEKSGLGTSGGSDAEGAETTGIGELGKTEGAKNAQAQETGGAQETKVQADVDLQEPPQKAGTGQLDSGSIRSVIQRYQGRIQKCYERHLKKNPDASGKVVVSFEVGRAGRVTSASSAQDSVGGGVGQCVANVIKGLRFPRPKGGSVMVNKSFVFQAGG